MDESAEVSIADISQMIADAFQLEHGLILDTTKADGQFKKTASNLKLRRYLPDFEFTPLRQAVQESVQWFIDNYDVARKWTAAWPLFIRLFTNMKIYLTIKFKVILLQLPLFNWPGCKIFATDQENNFKF